FTTLVNQGEELCALARVDGPGPETVVIRGTLNGRPYERELPVRDVTPNAGYLPRTWAKLEIERLLAEWSREPLTKLYDRIVELSKAMYVMTPFTSLLVLENEEMYQQYKVDRGRKDHWAMYPCLEKIPVVAEDADGQPIDPRKGARPTARQVSETILMRAVPRFVRSRKALEETMKQETAPRERVFEHWLGWNGATTGQFEPGRPVNLPLLDAFVPPRPAPGAFSEKQRKGSFGIAIPVLASARERMVDTSGTVVIKRLQEARGIFVDADYLGPLRDYYGWRGHALQAPASLLTSP